MQGSNLPSKICTVCKQSTTSDLPGSIFCQPWWLDAVADNRWDKVELRRDGRLIARMPYVWSDDSKKQLLMPSLTQTLGPWLDVGHGKLCTRLARHKDLMQELIAALPEFDVFHQNFHYSIDNWLPWYWSGFSQTTRYTYVIHDLSDMEATWNGFASNIKREIRKALRHVEIETPESADEFFDLNKMVFIRQSKSVPYNRSYLERLDDACFRRGQRKIFLARGADGQPHAACYLVWDADSAYHLMSGGHPELRRSGATSLCMWKAIQFAADVTKRFDFEGSMVEPIERFYRAFGANPMPYFAISKSNISSVARFSKKVSSKIKRAVLSKDRC